MREDTIVKNLEGESALFLYMILRECKCSVDGIIKKKKKGQVKVYDSHPYMPGNSCYSFYKENDGKLCTEVGHRVIALLEL